MRRRDFVCTAGAGLVSLSVPCLSHADSPSDSRLVLVLLRGALDGLAAVPAWNDPDYPRRRGQLALDGPGQPAGVLDLDGYFGLHPELRFCHELYRRRQLTVIHAVAGPYRERSHFDGQDALENGTSSAAGARDGWLNRALGHLPGVEETRAVALAQTVPLVLRGDAKVSSWAPSVMADADADTLNRIAWMYEADELLASRLTQGRAAMTLLDAGQENTPRRGGPQFMDALAGAAGKFLGAPEGPRVAVLESGGWDTHANQGVATGLLANRLGMLDSGMAELAAAMGHAWDHTVVLVVTEFGRTVSVNGTRGTDHGTGTVVLMAGGAVDGGRVVTDWPGLAVSDLYQGRDLMPTTQLHSVFKGVLHDHMNIPLAALDGEVFPDSRGRYMSDLVAA